MIRELITQIRSTMGHLLRLEEDAASEQEVIESIEKSVDFRGAKLWVLVLAIFVASLGLNTNSAAVIIGAMLISPLMGPIIGMGLAAGIYDFDLLRRSWRNYIVATLFSVTTATIYFLITPIAIAQSELLARTSPTIYDVLIALCGGLAGIIALSSRSQRSGNVIPGVAIATALMPPLCTVGFGIATANWAYAAGALYLFLINTIFIVFATLAGVIFIMRFKKKTFVNPTRAKRVKRLVYAGLVITIIPATVLTYTMVRESYFEQRVNQFIQKELHFDNTQVVSYRTDYTNRSFSVMLIGEEVDSLTLKDVRERMAYYQLEDVKMMVVQGSAGMTTADMQRIMLANKDATNSSEAIMTQQSMHVRELEQQLHSYTDVADMSPTVLKELQILYPDVLSVTMARGTAASADTVQTQIFAIVGMSSIPKDTVATSRIRQWLRERIDNADLRLIFQTE